MNTITWFEIPADDFGRAVGFYETILGLTLREERFSGEHIAVFPYERPGVSGAISDKPGHAGPNGPLIFLSANGRLDAALERVGAAGGRVLVPKNDARCGRG